MSTPTGPLAAVLEPFDLLCPTCGDHFRAPSSRSEPHRLHCGHAICAACLDAVTATPAPGCPICFLSLNSDGISVVDIALGELAEAKLQAEAATTMQDAASPFDSANTEPLKRHKSGASSSATYNPDKLGDLLLMCSSAAKGLAEHRLPTLIAVEDQLTTAHSADCSAYEAAMDDLISELISRKATVLDWARARHAAQVKQCKSLQEECTVSAAQLRAGIALIESLKSHKDEAMYTSSLACLSALATSSVDACSAQQPLPVSLVAADIHWARCERKAIAAMSACDRMTASLRQPISPGIDASTFRDDTAAVVATASEFALWPGVATVACRALALQSQGSQSNLDTVISTGALARFCDSADVLVQADDGLKHDVCEAITRFCKGQDSNRSAAGAGVMKLAAGMMSSSNTKPAVASSAQAVRWLASGQRSSTRDTDNIAAFRSAGGCQIMLKTLTAFGSDSGTCYHILDALVSLCLFDPFRSAWVEAGGLPMVISVMDSLAGNAPVQDRCCWALANLALHIPNKITIVTLGGLPRIYAALSNCKESAAVQLSGCRALASLAMEDANEQAILASGGLPHIYAALDGHLFDDNVQMEGCAALGNLAGQDPSKLLIANSGGVQRTVNTISAHVERMVSPALAEQCCLTLANITAIGEPQAVKVSSLDIECLCTVMRKWPTVATLQSEACRAIYNISVHCLALLKGESVRMLLEAAVLLQDEDCNYWANAALAALRQPDQ